MAVTFNWYATAPQAFSLACSLSPLFRFRLSVGQEPLGDGPCGRRSLHPCVWKAGCCVHGVSPTFCAQYSAGCGRRPGHAISTVSGIAYIWDVTVFP